MSYNLSTKLRAKETAVNAFHVSKDASPHLKVSLEKRMVNIAIGVPDLGTENLSVL